MNIRKINDVIDSLSIDDLNIGDKVTFKQHDGKKLKGIVKIIRKEHNTVFVVYSCDDNWENFADYTSQNSPIECLSLGWE